MHTSSSPEPTAPLFYVRFLALAGSSLLLAIVLESGLAIVFVYSALAGNGLGLTGYMLVQAATFFLAFYACFAAASPAMLAERHRVFRGALVLSHLIAGWAIQVSASGVGMSFSSDMLAEYANDIFLMMLGMVAGIWYAMAVSAVLGGWKVARRVGEAKRSYLSIRGMLFATAAAAVIFASPRFLPFLLAQAVQYAIEPAVQFIRISWMPEGPWPITTVSIESSGSTPMQMIVPLIIGAMFATTLVPAMWISRSRRAWLWLTLASGVLTALVAVMDTLNENSAEPVSTVVVSFASLFIGSLMATLHMMLWQRFGWHLIRVRRDSSLSLGSDPGSESKTPECPSSDAAN